MAGTKDITILKSLLPARAKVTTTDETTYRNYHVFVRPSIADKEYEKLYPALKRHFGRRLLELYTEETGHDFVVRIVKRSVKAK